MQFILSTLLLVFLTACGTDTNYVYIDKEVEKEVLIAQDFEGIFKFDNGVSFSYIELVASSDNEITILRDGQVLNSINPENDTLALHPIVTAENLEVVNGEVFLTRDDNYNSGQDLEEDISGSNIQGRKRTDYLIEKTDIGIRLTIKIYSERTNDNANEVVATRIFESI